MARIDREWQALGRDPSLGDVVWFEATEAGKELGAAWPDLRFTQEPRGELFRALLRWLCGKSREFLLVRRDLGIHDSPSLGAALAALALWRIAEEEDWRWPGTMLFGGSALVYRHRCEPAAATMLADLASGPFEWRQPALPEDLGFVDARGRALLADVAHERLLILDLRWTSSTTFAARFPASSTSCAPGPDAVGEAGAGRMRRSR